MAKKPVSDQMELFEDGGFRDQGNTKDPVSNNPVPVGSIKKEVRDDIPANLSEGEFVLPADVVRYHGLEKIMGFRDQAKEGLQKMEDMGQMGNSDQATIPDGVPFKKMAVGGNVGIPTMPTLPRPPINDPNAPKAPGTVTTPPGQQVVRDSTYQRPVQRAPQVGVPKSPAYRAPQYRIPKQSEQKPTYKQLMGAEFGQQQDSVTKKYVNPETGEERYIPFVNGEPIYPIPEGFVEEAMAEAKKDDPDINKALQSTSVRQQQDDSGDDGGMQEPDTAEYKVASTLTRQDQKNSPFGKMLSGVGSALQKISPVGMFLEKSGMLQNKPVEKFGGLFPADVSEATGMYSDSKDSNLLNTYAKESGYTTYKDMADTLGVQPTFRLGTKPGDVSRQTGKTYNYAGQSTGDDGSVAYSSTQDFFNAMAASAKTGWYGGTMTEKEIESYTDPKGKNYDPNWSRTKIDAFNREMGITYGKDKDDSKKQDQTKNELNATANSLGINPTGKTAKELESAINTKRAENKARRDAINAANTARGEGSTSGTGGLDDSSDFGNQDTSNYSGEGVGGWTAKGGFINKRTMTMSKTPPNKKKRGGLASRR